MANDDFSEPPRRADSQNPIFIFPDFWVWVTSEARGSVSVGFWGSCQLSPFWGVRPEGSIEPPPLPETKTRPLNGPHRTTLRVPISAPCGPCSLLEYQEFLVFRLMLVTGPRVLILGKMEGAIGAKNFLRACSVH